MMTSSSALELHRDDDLDVCLSSFEELVERCERIEDLGPLPEPLTGLVLEQFDTLVHVLDRRMRQLPPREAAKLGRHIQSALLPIMRRAVNGWRWYEKPRGYAGDYLSIAQMYDDEARGDGPVGALIDRCFLRLPAARAVQNRRELVVGEVKSTVSRCHDRPARVTSLAAGPAREIFDLYANLDEPRALAATLIDFDVEALQHCAAARARLELDGQIELVNANLIHVAIGRRTLDLAPQDLVYSIGLIDYFDDNLVVKLLDWIHAVLRPGGRVVLGNFHPRNPTRAIMDHVLDWKLVHRDEDAMDALFRASAFGAPCTRIIFEPQQINLFAECVKT